MSGSAVVATSYAAGDTTHAANGPDCVVRGDPVGFSVVATRPVTPFCRWHKGKYIDAVQSAGGRLAPPATLTTISRPLQGCVKRIIIA